MKAAGVAAVVVELVVNQADLTVADADNGLDPTTGAGFSPVRRSQPQD
jgi:hypothetical protein